MASLVTHLPRTKGQVKDMKERLGLMCVYRRYKSEADRYLLLSGIEAHIVGLFLTESLLSKEVLYVQTMNDLRTVRHLCNRLDWGSRGTARRPKVVRVLPAAVADTQLQDVIDEVNNLGGHVTFVNLIHD